MIKVTRTEEYLSHHGKEGQKWGVRNGPPYPLDRKKVNANKKRQTKDLKIVKNMSNDEIKEKILRMELENRYLNLKDDKRNRYIENGKKVASALNSMIVAYNSGVIALTNTAKAMKIMEPEKNNNDKNK